MNGSPHRVPGIATKKVAAIMVLIQIATLAQLVERVTRNDKVPSSILGGGSKCSVWNGE